MSIYNGRRAPNFSQYLEDLNAIPSPYDQALQQQQQDSFNVDAELALFTNTEFFDFDKFGDLNLPTFDGVEDSSIPRDSTSTEQNPDVKFLDLLNGKCGFLGFPSIFYTLKTSFHPAWNHFVTCSSETLRRDTSSCIMDRALSLPSALSSPLQLLSIAFSMHKIPCIPPL